MASLLRALLLLCVLLLPHSARSEIIALGEVDGSTLPTPTDSVGWAYGDLHYRPATLDLWVHVFTWGDLSSPVVAGHLHCCHPLTAETPVALHFPGIAAATSGSFEYTWDLTLASTFDPAFLASYGGSVEDARNAIARNVAGGSYVDLHTADHPGGEVGGRLHRWIPEPGTFLSAWLGLVVLAARTRPRARAARLPVRGPSGTPPSCGRDR